jgi:hypothetical protein
MLLLGSGSVGKTDREVRSYSGEGVDKSMLLLGSGSVGKTDREVRSYSGDGVAGDVANTDDHAVDNGGSWTSESDVLIDGHYG